jgi:hypothetical protein
MHLLIANNSASGGGLAGGFESIASATGTGSAGSITFTSIPQSYQHLQLRILCSDTYTGLNGSATIDIRFNSDTGSNYTQHALIGDGSTAQANGFSSTTNIRVAQSVYGTAGALAASIVDIHDYSSTTKYKTARGFTGVNANTATTDYTLRLASGLWMDTSAITSITIIPAITAFTTTSTFALYGIKAA